MDAFGTLGVLPDGFDFIEITPELWDRRDRVDELLPFVRSLVAVTGLVPWWEEKIAAGKKKPGRPNTVSVEAVLTGLITTCLIKRGFAHTEIARLLHVTISDADRNSLGIVPLLEGWCRHTDELDATSRYQKFDWATERRVGRVMKQMLEVINPSEWIQPRKLTDKTLAAQQRRDITPDELREAKANLDHVTQE